MPDECTLGSHNRGLLEIQNPQAPSGGFKVVVLTDEKKFNVTGQVVNGGPNEVIANNHIWGRDRDVGARIQGVSPGTNFNFGTNKIQSAYGLRQFQVCCRYQDNTDDGDTQDCVAMPSVLRVNLSDTPFSPNNCGTCNNANVTFDLQYGTGPTELAWKWGYQITNSANYICQCAFVSAHITTGSPGGMTFAIKSDFDAESSLVKYTKDNWDFTFPAGGLRLDRVGTNFFKCFLPDWIKVNPVPL